jgi:hypothetical protein
LGEASSATEGEGLREPSIADVADWGQVLSEFSPERPVPVPPVPSIEMEIQVVEPEPPTAPLQPSVPLVEPSVDRHPMATAASAEASTPGEEPPDAAPPDDAPPYMDMEVEAAAPVELPDVGSYGPSIQDDPALLTAPSGSTPLRGMKTPPPETPLPVLLLVDQARSAEGRERQELSRRINRWLDEMVREGGSRHVADWFHHLIENGRLEGLADAAGHSCHDTAVQGLLAMGFPYALEVRPEDLERLRPREQQPRSRKAQRDLKMGAAGVVLGGVLTELVLNLLRLRPTTGILTVEVGVALMATMALLVSGPRTALRNLGLAGLLVVSALSVSLGLFGGYAGLVSGLAGLVAALLFALHRS